MGITVGGTTITFNDGTTQSTAAGGAPTVAAGTYYYGPILPASTNSGSFVLGCSTRVTVSGTVRCQFVFGFYCTCRIYKNGVSVSGNFTRNTTNYQVGTYDLSVTAGDLVQLYFIALNGCYTAGVEGIRIGISTIQQGVVTGGLNGGQVSFGFSQ